MKHLIQSRSFLADAGMRPDSETWPIVRTIVDAVGILGCVVIILMLLLSLTMIPDLKRYLRMKNM